MAVSTKPSTGTQYVEAGSSAHTADLIAAQDRARTGIETTAKNWAPWVVGGLVLGAAVYFVLRD